MLLQIFLSFFAVGALTFGGGYAMLPILTREVVERRGWIDENEALDFFAIGQCLPGIIAVNTALFIGRKVKGTLGGVAAMLGVITPSVIIIIAIALVLNRFIDIPVVQHMFAGIRVTVAALIVSTVIKLFSQSVKNMLHIVVCVAVFAVMTFAKVSPVFVVLAAAIFGILTGRRVGDE